MADGIPVCGSCGRSRTVADDYDYSPLQAVTGRPFGWYSADDGEICGDCMTRIIRGQGHGQPMGRA